LSDRHLAYSVDLLNKIKNCDYNAKVARSLLKADTNFRKLCILEYRKLRTLESGLYSGSYFKNNLKTDTFFRKLQFSL